MLLLRNPEHFVVMQHQIDLNQRLLLQNTGTDGAKVDNFEYLNKMIQSYNCPVFFYVGRPECLDD